MTAPARAEFHPLTVSRVDRLTDDAAAVSFDVPDDLRAAYDFGAGQSVTVRRTIDGHEHRRSYSVCAPVGRAPRIGVREIPDGVFSRWLVRDVRPGDVVDVQTPTGRFRADPGEGASHLCIAAGSGITPMLSIAATVLQHPEARVTLLYGNRTSASVMFAEELADLKNRFGPRFHLVHVLSREPREVDLFSGRLDAERVRTLVETLVPVDDLDHVWLCGPLALVEGACEVLLDLGVDRERVHVELFHVDEPPPPLTRVDPTAPGETSAVTVVLDGRSTTLALPRDRSVLDGAQATRSDLPFACKGGVCGTCRAKLCDGEVDLRRNYALEEHELEQGFVLACQAYPVSDTLTVDFDA